MHKYALRPTLRTSAALLAAGLALPALAACGGTENPARQRLAPTVSPSEDAAGAGGAGATSEAPQSAPASPAPTPAAAASTAPTGSGALPGVPAVTNATDPNQEPVLAAGTGTAGQGLVVRDLIAGTGPTATLNDTVNVTYVGAVFRSGKVFDKSWGRPSQQPGVPDGQSQFPLSGVVPGFAQGIAGMKVGGRREIVIPPALGYGPQGGNPQAGIAADDTIVFVVDLTKAAPSS